MAPAASVSSCQRSLGEAAESDEQEQVEARVRILSHPGHYMNHEASHLIDCTSVEYWASLPGHVRDQAFVFGVDQGQHVLSRVEWKDRGDGMGVARLALEAQVGEVWQKLSTWDAMQTCDWQVFHMSMSLRSHQWRLSFLCNHGDENHLVVQAVRFIVKLPPTMQAHNVVHSQLISQRLWQDRLFADVTVICEHTGAQFPAHRAILAAASPVFAAMLSSEMRESQTREIRVANADEIAVRNTLEYIYTGTIGEGANCGMVVLGHQYDIPGLIEYAAPVALGNLSPENVAVEARTLRSHAEDRQLGPVFDALQSKVHENPTLLRALLLSV